MDVAILGASGDCGRSIVGQLVSARVLTTTERLQLVGRKDGNSASLLHGLMSDLTDAYAEHVPYLDVALSPEEIVADLWVVSAGNTVSPYVKQRGLSRNTLAAANAPIFRAYAEALARHGQGTEIVIVVSNPVELGVAYFAEAIGRDRVIGIGAYSDTLRFRQELAAAIGVRRQRISGFMLGEHGDAQVPIWSSVKVHGMSDEELMQTIVRVRHGAGPGEFRAICARERAATMELLVAGKVVEAFQRVETLSPDVRVIVKPNITHFSGSKTVLATASAAVDLVSTLLDGRDVLVAGQAMLAGDFYGMSGPLGVPVVAGTNGISRVVEIPLTDQEHAELAVISQTVRQQVQTWMAEATPATVTVQ